MKKQIKIKWNRTAGHWEPEGDADKHAIIPAGDRSVEFDINLDGKNAGVRLCFSNRDVFGVPFLEFPREAKYEVAVVGSPGDISSHHLMDAGTACAKKTDRPDPFDVTIGNP